MSEELIQKARTAESAEELLALAKAEGIDMTAERAGALYAALHPAGGELADDELDAVAGGGCYSEDGYLMTTIGYGCEHYEADEAGFGVDGTCCRCKYWSMRQATQLIVFGQPAPCTHPANRINN